MQASTPFLLSLSLIAAALPLSSGAADFTVTSPADSGAGSLRQAILDANAAPGATDVISFALPVAPRAYFRVRSFTTPPAAPAVLTP